MKSKPQMLRIRGNTKDRLRKLAKPRGWLLTEAVDRAVDALDQSLKESSGTRDKTAPTAA